MRIIDPDFISQARREAILWADGLIKRDPAEWCILDTETTGLRSRDQVLQISIVDGRGNPLIENKLIKPTVPIDVGAYQVHLIDEEMVKDADTFEAFFPTFKEVTKDKLIVIYNAAFDARILQQSAEAYNISHDWGFSFKVQCAMEQYARFVGDFDRGRFKWQKLPSGDHSSLGDCKATYRIIEEMALQCRPPFV